MVSKCAGSGAEQRDEDCYNIEVIGSDKKIIISPSPMRGPKRVEVESYSFVEG